MKIPFACKSESFVLLIALEIDPRDPKLRYNAMYRFQRYTFEFIRQVRAIILHTSFHILNLGIKTMKEILIQRSLLLFFFSFFRIENSFTIAWTRLNLFRDSKGKKRKKRTDVIALLRISNSVGYCLERSFQYSKPLFEIQNGIIVSKFQRHPIPFFSKNVSLLWNQLCRIVPVFLPLRPWVLPELRLATDSTASVSG